MQIFEKIYYMMKLYTLCAVNSTHKTTSSDKRHVTLRVKR